MKAGGLTVASGAARRAQQDPLWVRILLLGSAVAVLGILVVVPLFTVFHEALRHGVTAWLQHLTADEDTLSAIFLTLRVAPAAVLLNTVFGVAAAWLIARFRFPGRTFLTALIDLPFAVSPVVAGLSFMLLFGLQGAFGPWLREHDLRIVFATPGLILVTVFVTFPFVARELIPLMEALGSEEETAAVSLGSRAFYLFRRITLPNIRWGLLYGVILCNARAMGEFGAVYVVSGRITGQTDTLPLRVEKLFQEYNNPASFAVASLLCGLALVTLVLKASLEWQQRRELSQRLREARGGEAESGTTPPTRTPVARPVPAPKESSMSSFPCSTGIRVQNLTKRFGDFTALDRIDLDVPDGSLVALLGPSGSGKTTLLRVIAGLETADEGTVEYHAEDATHRSPRDRNVGFVFQHYALFRHMTVFENVAFGLRVRNWPRPRIEQRVHELLGLVQLESLANQMPSQLSGGQRQRIALARALAAEPKVLLLDEPFGALDAKVRQDLRQWLRRLHDELHVTSVFVTHDQEEAFEVADRVVVMSRGRIEQVGSPQEVFEHPANAFVMDFLGHVNVFHGRVDDPLHPSASPSVTPAVDSAVRAYVRPHELEIDRYPSSPGAIRGEVVRINAASGTVKIEVFSGDFGMPVLVEVPRERFEALALQAGEVVFVSPRRVRVFSPEFEI